MTGISKKTAVGQTNCWEFNHCPRERRELCPAFRKKAGRTCWLVAGTLCDGKAQGLHALKLGDCQKCDFFILVKTRQV